MKKILILILSLTFKSIIAQPPRNFYMTLGGDGEDIGYSAKQLLDGQYIVVGSTASYGNGSTDVYLIKVDSMGFTVWQKTFGGFGNDVGKSVIQLSDSGFVIAGLTSSFGAGGYDAYIIRTDKNGVLLWEKTFGGSDWDFANDLTLGSDGNIYVVGYTESFGAGNKDGFLIKYDLLGNLLLQKFIGGAENEELRAVIKTNDNMIATVGYTESGKDKNGDGYFIKLNLNGDTVFTRTFGGDYKDFASDIVEKNNGELVIVGAKTFSVNAKSNSYMFSLSANGTFLWENNYYHSIDNENYISVSNSFQSSNLTAYLRNVPVGGVGKQGNILVANPGGWAHKVNSFGGFKDEILSSIEPSRDGGFLCVGYTESYDSNGKDIYLIKLDSVIFYYQSIVDLNTPVREKKPMSYFENNRTLVVSSRDNSEISDICILDYLGRLVHKVTIHDVQARIDISNLNDAFYILKTTLTNGKTFSEKIVLME